VSEPFIRFRDATKDYGAVRVVENLNLDIARGEFVSLLGPSGSGKTTLLMMLAGFESVSAGSILLDGKRNQHAADHKRNMGVVFQNYALFPHMTVAKNVAFPLDMRREPKAATAERVRKALDMVQLGHLADRLPSQLSGGQQQRVALARALVFEPRVVLMDEPLGALDKQLREQMQLDIRDLHRRLGLTIIFVTHDQDEALTMSDRIAVFNQGKIQQCASPRQVYDHPANRFVAEFIGETNLLEGQVQAVTEGQVTLALKDGTMRPRPRRRRPARGRGRAAVAAPRTHRDPGGRGRRGRQQPGRRDRGFDLSGRSRPRRHRHRLWRDHRPHRPQGPRMARAGARRADLPRRRRLGDRAMIPGRSLRAFALVAPLLAYLALFFVWPLLTVITQSVSDPSVSRVLTRTAAEIGAWDGTGVPSAQVQAAFRADIVANTDDMAMGDVTRRLNSSKSGFRSLMGKTVRGAREPRHRAFQHRRPLDPDRVLGRDPGQCLGLYRCLPAGRAGP
jgi:putative spermidine/putrescine transport system ATP-binding protein